MNKRLALRTSVAGIAAAAMTATAIVSPVASADPAPAAGSSDTNATAGENKDAPKPAAGSGEKDKDAPKPEAGSGEKDKQGQESKPGFSDTKTVPTAGAGVGLGLITVLLNLIQVPALKDLNTNIQKQLGIFNPAQAARAEKVAPLVVGGTAIAGTILSILYLIDVTKPELLKGLQLPYAKNHDFDKFPERRTK